ncbi:hypothetical protein AMEX_G18061 [Astyanax mexicanus]|uniref:Immunoglobulin V-set domain-containing protein n=1 Tax=Astyanax mexicanus TaxID=7994 RepID=A0A8T2L5M0_ASTMX|nr:hypothetical protein AMEX_G18061 [Astyanax mexicanus]
MDLMLLWLIVAYCCIPSLLAIKDEPILSQSPPAIVLNQLNSTAELHCSTTHEKVVALYLKQRYSSKREVLYLYFKHSTTTIHPDYKQRVSVKGKCCEFAIVLTELQIGDSDGYYCEWVLTEPRINQVQSTETLIIIRDGDPEEECNKQRTIHHVLFMISVAITVTMFIICAGLLIWRIQQVKQSNKRYTPYKVHQRSHLPHCPNSRR